MEAVAQPPPETASDRTANTGGGVASDRLRVHAHLYKPRLKASSTVPDFQAELRQFASKQGRNAALEYATALGASHSSHGPEQALMDVACKMPFMYITSIILASHLRCCVDVPVWRCCTSLEGTLRHSWRRCLSMEVLHQEGASRHCG